MKNKRIARSRGIDEIKKKMYECPVITKGAGLSKQCLKIYSLSLLLKRLLIKFLSDLVVQYLGISVPCRGTLRNL